MGKQSPASFEMRGAREALDLALRAEAHFEYQISALEQAVGAGDALGFDLAKGLVDTVCKTILADQGQTAQPSWDTPKLVRQALTCLKIESDDGGTTTVPDPLRKTAQGLAQVVVGLCELRNRKGTGAHGRDAFEKTPGGAQIVFAARAADAILALVFECHHAASRIPYARHIVYDDNADFNEEIDAVWDEFTCGEVAIPASRVLFELERSVYRAMLMDFQELQGVGDDGDETGQ